MIIVAWSFVQPCSLWLGRGGFIAIIDPPSFYCFSGNHLGRTVAIKRIFRMMAAGWALWITGRWLDLPLSIGRYLPYRCSSSLLFLQLVGAWSPLGACKFHCRLALAGWYV